MPSSETCLGTTDRSRDVFISDPPKLLQISNTDFSVIIIQGSIQLESRPDLGPNTINLVPVSHCANIVVSASLCPPRQQSVAVVHVTPNPQMSFNAFLETLQLYGYNAPKVPYPAWRSALEQYVSSPSTAATQREAHALLPLFDWVTTDLPSGTKSRDLDNANAQAALRANGVDEKDRQVNVTQEIVGAYLAFMVEIGFAPAPEVGGGGGGGTMKKLPVVKMSEDQRRALKVVGRAGRA